VVVVRVWGGWVGRGAGQHTIITGGAPARAPG
jgi:hypothetical protein